MKLGWKIGETTPDELDDTNIDDVPSSIEII